MIDEDLDLRSGGRTLDAGTKIPLASVKVEEGNRLSFIPLERRVKAGFRGKGVDRVVRSLPERLLRTRVERRQPDIRRRRVNSVNCRISR